MTELDRLVVQLILGVLAGIGAVSVCEWCRRSVAATRTPLMPPTPARIPSAHDARERAGLLPPDGDGCGCCGRAALTGQLWCFDCAFHIAPGGPPHLRTWSAQYGEECPFAAFDGDQRDYGDETDPPRVRDGFLTLGQLHPHDQAAFGRARRPHP